MKLYDLVHDFWVGVVGLVVTAVGWLVRQVFTNQKQIAVMEDAMRRRDEDLKEIKSDVKQLIAKVGE